MQRLPKPAHNPRNSFVPPLCVSLDANQVTSKNQRCAEKAAATRRVPSAKLARGRFVPVVEIVVLRLSLLEAFHRTKDPCQDWSELLRFLSPLTVPSSPLFKMK